MVGTKVLAWYSSDFAMVFSKYLKRLQTPSPQSCDSIFCPCGHSVNLYSHVYFFLHASHKQASWHLAHRKHLCVCSVYPAFFSLMMMPCEKTKYRQHYSISGFSHSRSPCPRLLLHLPWSSFSGIIHSLSNLRTFDLTVSLPRTPDSSYNKLLALLGISANITISSGDSLTSTATQLKSFSHWFTHLGESPVYLLSSPLLPNLPPYLPNTLICYRFRTKENSVQLTLSLSHTYSGPPWCLPGLLYFPWDFFSSPPCEVRELGKP